MKSILIIFATIVFSISCGANVTTKIDSESFTLKKNESKQIGEFAVKMLSVGHTFGGKKNSVYANLEISGKGKTEKVTLDIGESTPLGEKFLKLESVNEKADSNLSDPFSATSCTLAVKDKA